MTNQLTLRDGIFAALILLQHDETEKNYPHCFNKHGDPVPQCHFCGETGLFVSCNGGILHLEECAFDLNYRVPKDVSNLHFFDQLAYQSLLRQITHITQYPSRKQEPLVSGKPITIWQPFCPFCKTLPHAENCIVTLAKAEIEQQGGEA